MIYALLSQHFNVEIYTVFPQFFLWLKCRLRKLFTFRVYDTRSTLPARPLSWHLQSSGETCQSQTCLAVTGEKEKYEIFWEVWWEPVTRMKKTSCWAWGLADVHFFPPASPRARNLAPAGNHAPFITRLFICRSLENIKLMHVKTLSLTMTPFLCTTLSVNIWKTLQKSNGFDGVLLPKYPNKSAGNPRKSKKKFRKTLRLLPSKDPRRKSQNLERKRSVLI